MEEKTILNQLEELAARLAIKVRYESFQIDGAIHPGGCCRIKGEEVVIINRKAQPRERIKILLAALKRRDLSDVFITPSLRELLDQPADS